MHAESDQQTQLVRGNPALTAKLFLGRVHRPLAIAFVTAFVAAITTPAATAPATAIPAVAVPTASPATHSSLSPRTEREWILLTYDQLTVRQTSATKVKSSGTVAMIMKKRGKSIKATVSINPVGSVAKTGKTRKQTITLKWNKKHKEYRGKFSLTTGGMGPVVVQARADKRIFTTTRRPAQEISTINGMGSGRTAISAGTKAVANVTVAPAFGRKIYVEKWVNGQWKRTKTLTTNSKKRTDTVRVELPAPSNNTTIDAYRVYSPATNQASKTRALRHNIILKQP